MAERATHWKELYTVPNVKPIPRELLPGSLRGVAEPNVIEVSVPQGASKYDVELHFTKSAIEAIRQMPGLPEDTKAAQEISYLVDERHADAERVLRFYFPNTDIFNYVKQQSFPRPSQAGCGKGTPLLCRASHAKGPPEQNHWLCLHAEMEKLSLQDWTEGELRCLASSVCLSVTTRSATRDRYADPFEVTAVFGEMKDDLRMTTRTGAAQPVPGWTGQVQIAVRLRHPYTEPDEFDDMFDDDDERLAWEASLATIDHEPMTEAERECAYEKIPSHVSFGRARPKLWVGRAAARRAGTGVRPGTRRKSVL